MSDVCGRFTSRTPSADLADFFAVDEVVATELGPRYNVAPTDDVYAVAAVDGLRRLGTMPILRLGAMRWGLVPWWADRAAVGARMINARAESLLDKPVFRPSFERRRCLVPADGFYEWEPRPHGAAKQPWYVRRRDGEVLAFAGLWSSWRPPGGAGDGGRLVSCTIVTTEANAVVAPVHDRMPVVLPRSAWAAWLDPTNTDVAQLAELLVPAPSALFERIAIGPLVSSVRNDGPELIEARDGSP